MACRMCTTINPISLTRVRRAILEADPADLRKWQQEDPSLETVRQLTTDQAGGPQYHVLGGTASLAVEARRDKPWACQDCEQLVCCAEACS